MEYIRRGVRLHKQLGFDAADFPMGRLLTAMGDTWQPQIEEARELAHLEGVPFRLCHLPFGVKLGDPEDKLEAFNVSVHKAIDAAKFLGVDFAVLHPNTTNRAANAVPVLRKVSFVCKPEPADRAKHRVAFSRILW